MLEGVSAKGQLSKYQFIVCFIFHQINLDTSLCVDTLLPQIASHFERMKDTFKQIDTLERAVNDVEASVTGMENELNRAESQLASESVFKSVLRPFLVKKYIAFH